MPFRTPLTLSIVLALAAGPALAQPGPRALEPRSTGEAGTGAGPERTGPERAERRIMGLQRRLAITPAQQPQWTAFADALRQGSAHMQGMRNGRAARAAASASDGLRSNADAARVYADDLQRLVPAFDALYATMSPEQRTTADRIYREFMGRAGRGQPGRQG